MIENNILDKTDTKILLVKLTKEIVKREVYLAGKKRGLIASFIFAITNGIKANNDVVYEELDYLGDSKQRILSRDYNWNDITKLKSFLKIRVK